MKTMKRHSLCLLLCFLFFLLLFSRFSFPKEKSFNNHVKIPKFTSPPKIDGKLEETLWNNGAVLDSFTQYEPQEGASPSEKTVVYIGYDNKNLYIAVHCFDSNTKAIRACLTKRDSVYGDDEVTIYLDTFNDKKRAFVFQVNPCGIQTDGIYTETRRRGRGRGGFFGFDKNWDTFFLSDARINNSGYTVELAIPFKSIRFPNTRPQLWGLQIMRTIRRKNEEIYLFPRSRDINGFLIQSGTLEIDGIIEKGKNFEVMPVLTGLKESENKLEPEAGINLKYGITSNLTADITYNPDFSQIEADMPQVDVNQRYDIYYPEKRPFFLEGKDLFDTPIELVYTRTIVDPQWGVKLTGKIGKTTLAFLSAYDKNPPEIDIRGSSEEEEEDEENEEENPYNSLVNVLRLKRDLYSESHIGFILTDKEMGSSWNSLADNYNRVVGLDGHLKFNNFYRFSFQFLGSLSKILEEETNLAPSMHFSLSRTSRRLSLSASWTSIHPDFESAMGFLRRKDIHSLHTRVSYSFLPQNDLIISIRPAFEYRRIYDFDHTLTDEQFNFSGFINGWRQSHIWTTVSSSLERYEGIDFKKKTFRANFSSEPFSWLSGNVSFSFGDGIYYDENPYLGYKTSLGLRLTLKPLTNLRLYYDFKNDDFWKEKGGEKEYEINIISQRLGYQLSRSLSLRLITDYNDYYKELYTSILFSYEYRPGTVFYCGIDDNQEKDESGIFRRGGRYYFIKFSYWWRI
ncbi:MAG: carbohydrate binding family 9 domain-containing protein [Candidatus Aminicenantes bacterium]|nr:carbohydrate binding family 9 domain-containing protein [Candidatus Aminicenantes bacterium]